MKTENDPQKILAYFWSVAAFLFIGYILIRFGQEKEILTLIIGIIGGTILGGIYGVYFNASHAKKVTETPGTTTADISATITTSPTEPGVNDYQKPA